MAASSPDDRPPESCTTPGVAPPRVVSLSGVTSGTATRSQLCTSAVTRLVACALVAVQIVSHSVHVKAVQSHDLITGLKSRAVEQELLVLRVT